MGKVGDYLREFVGGEGGGGEPVDLSPFIEQIKELEKRVASLSKTVKAYTKTISAQSSENKTLESENQKLHASLAKQVSLNHKLSDQWRNKIDASKALLIEQKSLLIEQKKSETATRAEIAQAKQLELQRKLDVEALNRKEVAEKKARIELKKRSELEKATAVKVGLLIDKMKSYDITLKKVKDGTKLHKKALVGDKIAYQQLARAIQKTRKQLGQYDAQGILSTRGTRNLGGSLSVLRSKILIASFAFGGMIRFAKSFVDASAKQEGAVDRVSSVIASQGYISKLTTEEVKGYASALQETTGVSDELTLESSALLLSFQNITKETFPRAQKAVLDMTAGLNAGKISAETLKTNTIQLAKALDDPTKGLSALGRAGTKFSQATVETVKSLQEEGKLFEAQTLILDELNKQYGDTASIDNYEKSARGLASALGDTAEIIGFMMMPRLKELNTISTSALKGLQPSDINRIAMNLTAMVGTVALLSINFRKVAQTIALFRKEMIGLTMLTGGGGAIGKIAKGLFAIGTYLVVDEVQEYNDAWADLDDEFNSMSGALHLKEQINSLTDLQLRIDISDTDANIKELTNTAIPDLEEKIKRLQTLSGDITPKKGEIVPSVTPKDSENLALQQKLLEMYNKDLDTLNLRLKEAKKAEADREANKHIAFRQRSLKLIIDTTKKLKGETLSKKLLSKATTDLQRKKIELGVSDEQLIASGIKLEELKDSEREDLETAIAQWLKLSEVTDNHTKTLDKLNKKVKEEVDNSEFLAKAVSDEEKMKLKLGLADHQLILAGIDLKRVTDDQRQAWDKYIKELIKAEKALKDVKSASKIEKAEEDAEQRTKQESLAIKLRMANRNDLGEVIDKFKENVISLGLTEEQQLARTEALTKSELRRLKVKLYWMNMQSAFRMEIDKNIEKANEEVKNSQDLLDKKESRNKEIESMTFETLSMMAQFKRDSAVESLKKNTLLEQAEMDRIRKTSEYKIAQAQGDDTKMRDLEKKARGASYNERLKKFNADQELARSNIYIKLAQAIMNAWADYGFPTALPIQGMASAMALMQIAQVNSAKQPTKYQYGGLVGGNLHSGGGTILEAERGEYVMNRNAVKSFGIDNMNAINQGSAPINITFNSPIMSEDHTEDIIIPQIKRALERGADIGIS